jgi:oligopeptide/dipeptide ABC transporter ATP-binding protein
LGMSLVFVSHDLGVIAKVCDRIAVMYAGEVVETGPTDVVLSAPRHPYTAALLAAVPSYVKVGQPLAGIGGAPPDPRDFPTGCRFAPRCSFALDACLTGPLHLVPVERQASACLRAAELGELAHE